MSHHRCCDIECAGPGGCCEKGVIYDWPAGVGDGNVRLILDYSATFNHSLTVYNDDQGGAISSYGFNMGGVVSGGYLGRCAGSIEAFDSDSAGPGADGERHDATVHVEVRRRDARVNGPGYRHAESYRYASGFDGHLIEITLGGEVRTPTETWGEFPNSVTGLFAISEKFFLGFPCDGLVGFSRFDVADSAGGSILDPFDTVRSPVITPFGTVTATPGLLVAGGVASFSRTDHITEPEDRVEHYSAVIECSMSHTKSDPDDLGSFVCERIAKLGFLRYHEGELVDRSLREWRAKVQGSLEVESSEGGTYAVLSRCPDYNVQVPLYCAGAEPSDCCTMGAIVCSKQDDAQPIVYRTVLTDRTTVRLALADGSVAVMGLPIPGNPFISYFPPDEVSITGTVANASNPCLPPSSGHPLLKRRSPLRGIDGKGVPFTVFAEERINVVPDPSPDGRRMRVSWTLVTDRIKHPGLVEGDPLSPEVEATIEFTYDTSLGDTFNPLGSRLSRGATNDSGWPSEVGIDLRAIGVDGPCLRSWRVVTSGAITSTLTEGAEPLIAVGLDIELETLNLAECAPSSSPVVLPTAAQSAALAASRRTSGGRRMRGGRKCGGGC